MMKEKSGSEAVIWLTIFLIGACWGLYYYWSRWDAGNQAYATLKAQDISLRAQAANDDISALGYYLCVNRAITSYPSYAAVYAAIQACPGPANTGN